MFLSNWIKWFEAREVTVSRYFATLTLTLLVGVTVLVYTTGGIRYVYSHSMYIPVVLGALVYGLRGGVVVALLGGVALGPLMPIDTLTGEMQPTVNWLYRTLFFVIIGALVGSASDLLRVYIHQIRWQLVHNVFTLLPNKVALLNRLNRDHELLVNQSAQLYLIDISNLEELSLQLGQDFSRTAVIQTEQSLRENLACETEIYQPRFNHLAVLVPNSLQAAFGNFVPQMECAFSSPVTFEGIPVLLEFHCGSLPIDDVASDPDGYMRKAEICLSEGHARQIRHLRYSPELQTLSRQNIELLGMFKQALDEDILTLHYQPKYELSTRRIIGVEALLRWTDSERGAISPGAFIPIVEGSMLMHRLTTWVIDKALREFKDFRKVGLELQNVAVNISATNLHSPDFVSEVKSLLRKYALPPHVLELELTENAVMKDFALATEVLRQLANHGVVISIDDFGTGYCSLQYLDELPVSALKIDQMFIRTLLDEQSKQHIVRATIGLAKDLGLEIVAEGIELEAVEPLLQSMGCTAGQGYFYCRPLPALELRHFITQACQGSAFPPSRRPAPARLP
ncbi:MAG: EAL domain-containing protein [Pseudohongiellaceae bacterium]